MFKKVGVGCLVLFAILLGFVGGIAAVYWIGRHNDRERLEYRLNGAGPIRPPFLRIARPCRARTPDEVRLDKTMLDVERTAQALDPSPMNPVHGYVVSYFGWHWVLTDSDGYSVCRPAEDLVLQLAPMLDRSKWPEANTAMNDLRLVERLPPSAVRAEGLAHIAFLRWIPPSSSEGEDARPYARQLLGDQGQFATPWRNQAMAEIGGDTRLGTSAAYLAVGIAPAAALPRVQKAMTAKLDASRKRKTKAYATGGDIPAIRDDDGNRLIELGYALARGGKAAEPYSAPIIAMLDEVIARPAPPFGLLAAKPTEFCRIARYIGGRAAAAANAKDFCSPGFKGGDGRPRDL